MKQYYDVRHLVYKRGTLPKGAPDREEVERSIRYLYRWMSEREFRAFLFLCDCVGQVGRALAVVLQVFGLAKLNWWLGERLKRGYSNG